MKKIAFLLTLGAMVCFQELPATNPVRRVVTVKQSDGSTLAVRKEGNSRYAFYSTIDGIALLRGKNGDLQYARIIGDELLPSGHCAHERHLRTLGENETLLKESVTTKMAFQKLDALYPSTHKHSRGMGNLTHDGIGIYGEPGSGPVKSIGTPTIPVIMVEFPDRKFLPGTNQEKVSRMLNEKGYNDERFCKGSVKDYFTSQSNGLFIPSFEVVAKVEAAQSYAYYGKNGYNGRIDTNVRQLIKEAITLAHQNGVRFKKFAKDAGRVPLVSIIYAGPGEHSAFELGSEDYLWAHFSETSFTTPDGVVINSYFVGNETQQTYRKHADGSLEIKNTRIDGIGVFCHEFGHALGLPDFYPTRGNEKLDTPGFWSVMDYGQFFYEGYAPIGYSAFERSSLGWIDLKELTDAQYAELYPFGQEEKGNTAYVIRNDANEKEYYILENRQPGIWYPELMGKGLLITHVDFDANMWAYNTVNNEKEHQRYEVIPADNVKNGYEGNRPKWDYFKADLFPGLTQVTEFTDSSRPSSKVYMGAQLNKPVYNIKLEGDVLSFSFKDKQITGISKTKVNASEEEEEIFTLTGRKIGKNEVLLPGVYLVKKGGKVRKMYRK